VSDPRQLEARVERIERSLSGSSLMQMHDTLQGMLTSTSTSIDACRWWSAGRRRQPAPRPV
jgi:hypothetical protein